MASTLQASIGSFFFFFFFFFLIISPGLQMIAGRNIPTDAKVEPESFGHFDGSVLIPGLGRVMVPRNGAKPFHYNPITGAPGRNGFSVPGVGGWTGGAGGHRYIPGGDDTLLPNPGVELPNPFGGVIPAPSRP